MKDDPNDIEMPSGLMARMAHHTRAMDGFFSLTDDRRASLVQYIQSASTGTEAKSRIEETVEALEAWDHRGERKR